MALPIKNVSIVGAGGHVGSFIAKALLGTGKHTVTAITRADSTSELPAGIHKAVVDYNDSASLVRALQGQDALIITLSHHAAPDAQADLFRAAAQAGVKWVLPNEWGVDTQHPAVTRDIAQFARFPAARQTFADISQGRMSYICLVTGFWYEWSLSLAPAFGFDIPARRATFYDDGAVPLAVSTWPHVGRTVAALLSLPAPALQPLANRILYTSSFTLSQRDMLASLCRATHTAPSDWSVSHEPVVQRYTAALQQEAQGDMLGFVKKMYARLFYPDGVGDFASSARDTLDQLLSLPAEDLDAATLRAVHLASQPPPF